MPVSYIEIDRGALRHNIRLIRSMLPKSVQAMAVVKADGYGHGAIETLRIALEEGYAAAAIARVQDGCLLRKAGFTCPIYILGLPLAEDMPIGIEGNFILPVDDTVDLDALEATAAIAQKSVDVMLVVDTGMNRIGAHPGDIPLLLEKINARPHLRLHGAFTHMAGADLDDKTSAKKQLRLFDTLLPLFPHNKNFVLSAANSAGILDLPPSYYNMVRPGIILYGLLPSDTITAKPDLHPAMRMVSHITHVQRLDKDEAVGYGGTYVAPHDMTIATVPIGYADGYPWSLSNKGVILINGQRCPVVGKICMDQCMVAVNETTRVGDEAVLLGKQGAEYISAEELSALAATIPYEFICGLKRLPRIFVGE